ncbi:MAG TPA: response regulator transcription factor [Caulobacter sp.]|nr:response regulator transcription factor [Caulobacter sp.]
MNGLRIMVADEQPVVRWGVRQVIEARQGWQLCGEAASDEEAVSVALTQRPDIAVIGLAPRGGRQLGVIERFARAGLEARVLIFSSSQDDEAIAAGLAAGAQGYVLKTDSLEEMERAIATLASRRSYLSPAVASRMRETRERGDGVAEPKSLTERELEVTRLVVEGLSNRQIASLLGRSVKTIESHRAASMRKAGVRSAAGLVRFAIRHRIAGD